MKAIVASAALLFACTSVSPAGAQQSRLVLEPRTADAIVARCIAHARDAGQSVAVAVFDHSGELVSFSNHGAAPGAAAVAQWKGRSAAVYRRSTRETGGWNVPTAPMISTIEGGVPLFAGDVPLGGVGVSGAPSAFDAECATVAAEATGLSVEARAH